MNTLPNNSSNIAYLLANETQESARQTLIQANQGIKAWLTFWHGTKDAPHTPEQVVSVLNADYAGWSNVMISHYQKYSGLNAALQTAGVTTGFATDKRLPAGTYGVPCVTPDGVTNNGTAFVWTAPASEE